MNKNAESVADMLKAHPRSISPPLFSVLSHANNPTVKQVFYPKYSPTRPFYDHCRCPNGGYGGLLSVTFFTIEDAIEFFDTLDVAKGPSLGTNFTLASPYTLLAHYGELEWARGYGVEENLVRISVGLEETAELVGVVRKALEAVEPIGWSAGV